jgi:hypothetical protein
MSDQSIDLVSLLQTITENLSEHREELNRADTYNGDHGDNIVEAFRSAQEAVAKSKGKSAASKLQAASRALLKQKSGSAQLYGKGFSQAAKIFKGKELTPDTLGSLIEALMGSQPPQKTAPENSSGQAQAPAGGDLLTSLLGSLTGQDPQANQPQQPTATAPQGGNLLGSLLGGLVSGEQQQTTQHEEEDGGNLLESLLGGLTGSQQSKAQPQSGDLMNTLLGSLVGPKNQQEQLGKQSGLDMGDLLSGAFRYYAAKRSGSSDLEAIMSALSKSSPMGRSQDRTQSGALIIQSILSMLGNR